MAEQKDSWVMNTTAAAAVTYTTATFIITAAPFAIETTATCISDRPHG
jgi:hypothetical protein